MSTSQCLYWFSIKTLSHQNVCFQLFKNPGLLKNKSPDLFSFTVSGLKSVVDQHGRDAPQTADAQSMLTDFIHSVRLDGCVCDNTLNTFTLLTSTLFTDVRILHSGVGECQKVGGGGGGGAHKHIIYVPSVKNQYKRVVFGYMVI